MGNERVEQLGVEGFQLLIDARFSWGIAGWRLGFARGGMCGSGALGGSAGVGCRVRGAGAEALQREGTGASAGARRHQALRR